MSTNFPKLFSPLKVGTVTMKNRIQTGPMSIVVLDSKGGYTDECFGFYEALAAGGAAVITLGESIIGTKNGMTHAQQIRFDNPDVPYYLQKMADIVHAHGALIDIEISHGGGMALPKFNNGEKRMGPSNTNNQFGKAVREMTREDMDEVKEGFCKAAEICRDCGFDMVMIHLGHGWLLHQFMNPTYNQRTDEYGGSIENRCRFPLEILQAVRERVGKTINIDMRISGAEFVEGGTTIEECLYLCSKAQDYVDIMNISAGLPWGKRMVLSVLEERGLNSEFSAAVKKVVTKCPVSSVGGYTDPALMERYLEEGRCDSFILGRSILADPQLPNKARTGREKEIHQCLRCFICNDAQYRDIGKLLRCAINPIAGREPMFRSCNFCYTDTKTDNPKKIVIAGAGPGGMVAAITAAKAGHKVVLCEKSSELGGWLRMEKHLYFKKDMVNYVDTLAYEMSLYDIDVRMNTEVTKEYLEKEGADYVIAAVGSKAWAPDIKGKDLNNVCYAVDCFNDNVDLGQKIVIIGGGAVGCEVGLQLATDGKDVSIIEMRDKAFADATNDYRRFIMTTIKEKTKIFCGYTVKEIVSSDEAGKAKGIIAVDKDGNEQFFEADNVLLATGLKARSDEAEALRSDKYELITIGDAVKAAKVYNAVRQGFDAIHFLN